MTESDLYEQYCKLQEFITNRMNELDSMINEGTADIQNRLTAKFAYNELNNVLTESNRLLESI